MGFVRRVGRRRTVGHPPFRGCPLSDSPTYGNYTIMPTAPKQPCRRCGRAIQGGGYCETCRPTANKAARNPHAQNKPLYRTPAWSRLRNAVANDTPWCAACLAQGTYTPGHDVDHIIPVHGVDDPLAYDHANLQHLCKSCHVLKTMRERNMSPESNTPPHVTLIAGPPASGKTTWALKHMTPGDLLWDLDGVMAAISGRPLYETSPRLIPVVSDLGEYLKLQLTRPIGVTRAWIIECAPTRAARQAYRIRYDAHVVVIEAKQHVCLHHVRQRNASTALYLPIIKRWWSAYEPDNQDQIVIP